MNFPILHFVGFQTCVENLKSLWLTLALVDGYLTTQGAVELSRLEQTFQVCSLSWKNIEVIIILQSQVSLTHVYPRVFAATTVGNCGVVPWCWLGRAEHSRCRRSAGHPVQSCSTHFWGETYPEIRLEFFYQWQCILFVVSNAGTFANILYCNQDGIDSMAYYFKWHFVWSCYEI